MKKLPLFIAIATTFSAGQTLAAQVINTDLIVTQSACVGVDCVNGEVFGFDTIRLKENNLRIRFYDTSNSASFPTTDWQLTANDSINGGANKFSIEDIDSGRTPFTIQASSRNDSLFISSYGRVGFNTSTPATELHVADGDTPTLRLDQDGSSGWGRQVWDIAGNETNFFLRDVTNSSNLPFRIRTSAPHNSLFINTNGNIGLGIDNPSAKLDVMGTAEINGATIITQSDGTTNLTVQETSTTNSKRTLLKVENYGIPTVELKNTAAATYWEFSQNGSASSFRLNNSDDATQEFVLNNDGDLSLSGGISATNAIFSGTVTVGGVQVHSSRALKEDIVEADSQVILNKLSQLPVMTWKYKTSDALHLGPMAEDFSQAFGYGTDDKSISVSDLASIAAVGVKELHNQLKEKDQKIDTLEQRVAELERLINLQLQANKGLQHTSVSF